MKLLSVLGFCLSSSLLLASPPARKTPVKAPAPPAVTELRRGTLHVEFGERELGGQRARGAVTLWERPEVPPRSLLKPRLEFRAAVNRTVH